MAWIAWLNRSPFSIALRKISPCHSLAKPTISHSILPCSSYPLSQFCLKAFLRRRHSLFRAFSWEVMSREKSFLTTAFFCFGGAGPLMTWLEPKDLVDDLTNGLAILDASSFSSWLMRACDMASLVASSSSNCSMRAFNKLSSCSHNYLSSETAVFILFGCKDVPRGAARLDIFGYPEWIQVWLFRRFRKWSVWLFGT